MVGQIRPPRILIGKSSTELILYENHPGTASNVATEPFSHTLQATASDTGCYTSDYTH